jgi:hypothetical protein
MDHSSRQTRTSLGDKIAMGILAGGLGLLLLVGGVLILVDVLNLRGFGTASGVIWCVLGAVFLGVTLAELPKDNAFQVDGASSDDTGEIGMELDYDID